mgnify:CR=1 FL=1
MTSNEMAEFYNFIYNNDENGAANYINKMVTKYNNRDDDLGNLETMHTLFQETFGYPLR